MNEESTTQTGSGRELDGNADSVMSTEYRTKLDMWSVLESC